MNISEKVAYLRGLATGLSIDESTKEGKLLLAMLDIFDEVADNLEGIEVGLDMLADQVDSMDEELECLSEDECGCGGHHHHGDFDDDSEVYQVTCGECGEEIYLDEEMLDEGEMICPKCGQNLEFDLDGAIDEEV